MAPPLLRGRILPALLLLTVSGRAWQTCPADDPQWDEVASSACHTCRLCRHDCPRCRSVVLTPETAEALGIRPAAPPPSVLHWAVPFFVLCVGYVVLAALNYRSFWASVRDGCVSLRKVLWCSEGAQLSQLDLKVQDLHEQKLQRFIRLGLAAFTTGDLSLMSLTTVEAWAQQGGGGQGQGTLCNNEDPLVAWYKWVAEVSLWVIVLLFFDVLSRKCIVTMFFCRAALDAVDLVINLEHRVDLYTFFYLDGGAGHIFWLPFVCLALRGRECLLLITCKVAAFLAIRLAMVGPGALVFVNEPGCQTRAMLPSKYDKLQFPSLGAITSAENLGEAVVLIIIVGMVLAVVRAYVQCFSCDVIRSSLELQLAMSTKEAVIEMLDKLCDCVVYLDSELNVMGPTPKLAGLLHTRKKLEGTSFLRIIPEEDHERFRKGLQSSSGSHQLLPLRDAFHVKVSVQIFHTVFQDLGGRSYYILGIDELGERVQKPRANLASHVAEAMATKGGQVLTPEHDEMGPRPCGDAVAAKSEAGQPAYEVESASQTGTSIASEGGAPSSRLQADFKPSMIVKECTVGFEHLITARMSGSPITDIFEDAVGFRQKILETLEKVCSGTAALPCIEKFGPTNLVLRGGAYVKAPRIYSVILDILFPDPAVLFAGSEEWDFENYIMSARVTWRKRLRPSQRARPRASSVASPHGEGHRGSRGRGQGMDGAEQQPPLEEKQQHGAAACGGGGGGGPTVEPAMIGRTHL